MSGSHGAKVRVGLIGAGSMANSVHYPSLAAFPDVEMAALCDIDAARLAATGARFGIERRYADFRRMLDDVAVDAVYILMPPHQLYDLVIECLGRGKHVFLEKPPGITADQTYQMACAAERAGAIAMVGFNRRYAPLLAACRERVQARGGITHCVATFYKDFVGQPPYYGGAVDILTSDCIHAVDTLRWMGGEPGEVVSIVQRREATYDNVFNALIRFESGATGVLLGNWTVGGRTHQFEMHGRRISVFANPDREAMVIEDNASRTEVIDTKAAAGSDEFRVYYGYEAENRHFVDCVREGREPLTSLRDAVRTMQLVERIYRAAI